MAANNNEGFLQQIKEMRSTRIQQLRHMNADQRYQSSMINYQRDLIRSNEKMIGSISALGKTITGLVGTIGRTGGAAIGAAASGVSSISNSIVSGLGKALPFAIAGLLTKIMLWDNMSGDTKSKLSGGFGKLFTKLFSFVEDTFDNITVGILRTVEQIKEAYKSLDIKFPIINTIVKKIGAFVDMIAAGFQVIKPFFEGIIDLAKADPAKVMENTLKIMAGGAFIRYIVPIAASVAGSVITTLIANRLLVASLTTALGAGAATGAVGRAISGRAGAAVAAGVATTATAANSALARFKGGRPGAVTPELKASSRMAARTATVEATAAAAKRGAAGRVLAFVPFVGWMLSIGLAMTDVYEAFEGLNVDKKELDEAAAMAEQEPAMTAGLTSYGTRAPKPTKENIEKAAQYEKESRGVSMEAGLASLASADIAALRKIQELQGHAEIVNAYKRRTDQKKREEQGQELKLIQEYNELWADMDSNERKWAIQTRYILVESPDFYYYPDEKGKMVRISPSDYKKGVGEVIKENVSEIDERSFKTGLVDVILKNEALGSYDIPYGGTLKDGKVVPKFVPFPEGITGVSQMTGRQLLEYQEEQRKATVGKVGAGPKKGTGAIGGFQWNQENTRKFYESHPELLDELFSPDVQNMMFSKFMKGRVDELIAKGDMEGLEAFVRQHWQIFSKSTGASEELAQYFSNPPKVSENKSKLSKDKSQRIAIDQYKEAYKRFMAPVSSEELQLMTVGGKNVVDTLKEKAEDYFEKRKKSVKDKMQMDMLAVDPEDLKNQLMDALQIMSAVNQVRGDSKPGDVTNINNINNTNSSSYSGGGSTNVYPGYVHPNYTHTSTAGVPPAVR